MPALFTFHAKKLLGKGFC